jgi:hypothetical protein
VLNGLVVSLLLPNIVLGDGTLDHPALNKLPGWFNAPGVPEELNAEFPKKREFAPKFWL